MIIEPTDKEELYGGGRESQRCGSQCKEKRVKRSRLVASALHLLSKMQILRKDVAPAHDKSYDSPYLKSLDHGGLKYVHPNFLYWAKHIMKQIRASITLHQINKHGSQAQSMAYKHVTETDKEGPRLFKLAVKSLNAGNFSEDVIGFAQRSVVNFAFHARSEVEWKKYRALTTDRAIAKEKKLGLRVLLKATCSS